KAGSANCSRSLHDALPISRSGNTGNNTIVMPNYRRGPGSDIRQQIIRWKGQKNLSPETGLLCNSEKNSRSGKMPAHIGLGRISRSEEHTSELQSRENLVCR